MFRYYVTYVFDHDNFACCLIERDESLETYDQIIAVAKEIASRFHDPRTCVVIQNWKKLQ